MSKLMNTAFLLSLSVWCGFILTILVMGAISITEWGGMTIWLIPIISVGAFGIITKLKGDSKTTY